VKLTSKSSGFSNATLASIVVITALSLYSGSLFAQELSPLLAASSTIEAPKPNPPKPIASKPNALKPNAPEPRAAARWRFALDREAIGLGVLQGSAELFDGIATHRFVHAPTCPLCVEVDPVCRFFLGPKPTWPRMLTMGTLEVFGAAYLHQSMRRSPYKLVRWLAPIAPLTLTGIHIGQGLGVVGASTNPCSPLGPGYVVASQSPSGDQLTCSAPTPAPIAGVQLAPRTLLRLQ
jgi:hypothetical protein